MLDIEIREAVELRLRALHGAEPETRYRHELGLCMGETRVDIAAINGRITGCEIKGSRDKLVRLPRQVELYGKVLDSAVLVVEGKHTERATAMVPSWWGIWHVSEVDGELRLHEVQPAGCNPNIDPISVAQLLWRDEVIAVLKRHGQAAGLARRSRWFAWDRLVEVLPLQHLQAEVREQLKVRPRWPGGQ